MRALCPRNNVEMKFCQHREKRDDISSGIYVMYILKIFFRQIRLKFPIVEKGSFGQFAGNTFFKYKYKRSIFK